MDGDVGNAPPLLLSMHSLAPHSPPCASAIVPKQHDALASSTSPRYVTETVNGSHHFVIQGYLLTKGMGVGKRIASEAFYVGGYQWVISFYPDGKYPEDNSAYISIFIALASKNADIRALFELMLLDQSGKGEHKVHSHFDKSPVFGPYALKSDSMWGYRRFFRRTTLEKSDFLKDDCLKVNCKIGVLNSTIDHSGPHFIQISDSDISCHFGSLLYNDEGVDVVLNVGGERFHAHKLVLAARSSVFESIFFNDKLDEGKNEVDDSDELEEFAINNMEPNVFKAMLHFIYKDTLINNNELGASNSDGSINDTLAAKFLAAADKYDLGRLKLLCESYLCKSITVTSVASILALANRHCAMELKAVCQNFLQQTF